MFWFIVFGLFSISWIPKIFIVTINFGILHITYSNFNWMKPINLSISLCQSQSVCNSLFKLILYYAIISEFSNLFASRNKRKQLIQKIRLHKLNSWLVESIQCVCIMATQNPISISVEKLPLERSYSDLRERCFFIGSFLSLFFSTFIFPHTLAARDVL